jgi:hypothetical protein
LAEALGDSKDYLVAEMTIRVEFYDGAGRHQTAADRRSRGEGNRARHQRATATSQAGHLETGLVIQVPPVNEGDKVRVNTETGEHVASLRN